jgi:hypothetical protein
MVSAQIDEAPDRSEPNPDRWVGKTSPANRQPLTLGSGVVLNWNDIMPIPFTVWFGSKLGQL